MLLFNSPSEVVCLIDKISVAYEDYHLILVDWCPGCEGRIFVYSRKHPHVVHLQCPHCETCIKFVLPPHHYRAINY